jgi:2-succinyl-6-hydroxy-2,4-cyclohexadiene-1-carboxylate synthase
MNILVDGLTYHIEICGEGFPLLMLHGFTGRGSNWSPFCTSIGSQSKLIMPDIIGHGFTELSEEIHRYDIESIAKDMIEIINHLGFEKVDLLGYSMGGRLALSIALLFPERVRKLILESASPGLDSEQDRQVRQDADKKLALSILEKGVEAFIDFWEDIPLFKTQKSLNENVQSSIRLQRLTNKPTGLANSLIGMGTGSQPSYWGRLHEVKAETLMIVGELDDKFCQIAEEMQKNLQKGEIYKIKHAGHAIHVEQPEKFGTIVSEFLRTT